jgi:hypothetical protein
VPIAAGHAFDDRLFHGQAGAIPRDIIS